MTKQSQSKPVATKNVESPGTKPKAQTRPKAPQKKRKKASRKHSTGRAINRRRQLLLVALETGSLAVAAVALIMVLLGYSAVWFAGTRFFVSLLPFAVLILAFVVIAAAFLVGWGHLRSRLQQSLPSLPAFVAVVIAIAIACVMRFDQFSNGLENFRTLLGGRQEDRKISLTHQVFAAYRRIDQSQLQAMIERAGPYAPVIAEAARGFGVDVSLLEGVAAAESSFLPRQSKDGGKGLFQITQVPPPVVTQAKIKLGVEELSLNDPRQNAFIAAAQLKYYLAEMNNNLFLGLLAYNIGPANGGLRFIMQQYGVTNFITIQPYLQQLPRDYPIRVLSYALAFRLWHQEGRLLAYEVGWNARIIQRIGIPGLSDGE